MMIYTGEEREPQTHYTYLLYLLDVPKYHDLAINASIHLVEATKSVSIDTTFLFLPFTFLFFGSKVLS